MRFSDLEFSWRAIVDWMTGRCGQPATANGISESEKRIGNGPTVRIIDNWVIDNSGLSISIASHGRVDAIIES